MTRRSAVLLALCALLCILPWSVVGASETPSVAAQLARDGIRPDSALARLVAANQDFSMLRPEEANDKLPYPLWLRVYWRKMHPEGRYEAGDPTGGYPRALRDIYRWMIAHQDLAATPVPTKLAHAGIAEKTSIGGNLQISGAAPGPRSESDIRINFRDRTKIIAASNEISGASQAQFYSTDGGATWAQTSLPLQSGLGDSFQSDPTVDWTSDGTAWSMTLGINGSATILKGRAYKSTNNGATWTFDGTFSGSQTGVDKEQLWIDHSDSSPFKDNIYVTYHNNNPAFVARRTSAGWQTPVQVSGAETVGTAIGGDVKTNANGDVFVFWPATGSVDTGPGKLFVAKSTNGAASFGAPVLVATTFDSYDIGVPSFDSRRALIYTTAGAYRTATRNEVYTAWVDLTGASGCTSGANEPGTNAASTCKTRIWFSRSTDGGATWSAKVMLNNGAGLNDQYNPWLAVDETNGMLAIMYYDTVGDATRLTTNVWYQSSFDGGVTWSTAVKVTTASTDETGSGADLGNQYGDYNGLSASGGLVFPSWTDRRLGGNEQIWTAPIDERVTVGASGAGTGTGTMTGAGVACAWTGAANTGTCSAKVPQLATSSIVAAPTGGATFGGWSGCTSTTTTTIASDTCNVAPSGNVSVTATFTASAPSNDANLSNLVLSTGTLVPAFASGTTGYTVSINTTTPSITVTPTAANAGATIKVNGISVASGAASAPITLNVGSNVITVLVTAQDGVTTKTYTVTVNYSPPGACIYALAPPDIVNFPKAGGTTDVVVTVPAGCPVTATSYQPWVSAINIVPSGGTTTVTLQIAANPGAARATSIVLAERLYLVTQAAGP